MKLTLAELRKRVQDEHDAYLLLEELRWYRTPVCPHCGHDKSYFLNPTGGTRGTGRPKADGKRTQSVRRVWKCARCRKQFSVLTGTIFHGTKVSLVTWITVMVQMCSAKNGISAREVERMHEVTPETAWYMLHRLREAMKREPLAGLLTGTIVADETFNRRQAREPALPGHSSSAHRQERHGAHPRPQGPALTLVNRTTGEVRSRVVPDVTKHNLRSAIWEQSTWRSRTCTPMAGLAAGT